MKDTLDINNKVLRLPINKKWFDMILSGRKKEEYREVKDYWMTRIAHIKGRGTSYNFSLLCTYGFNNLWLDLFDYVEFKNGYRKDSPTALLECNGIVVDQGKKVWGAPDYRTFVIKLGKIVSTKNVILSD